MDKDKINVQVMSIHELLSKPHLHNREDTYILFTSTDLKNYFDFGSTYFTMLSIQDVDNPKISISNKFRLHSWLNVLEGNLKSDNIKSIYVCCDAGLRRSPALALYTCSRLGLEKQAKEIINRHRFLHQKLYDNLCELGLELL